MVGNLPTVNKYRHHVNNMHHVRNILDPFFKHIKKELNLITAEELSEGSKVFVPS
jgi:hypothetical protein